VPHMVAADRPFLTQMRRGTVEFCVLALLRDEERYGFDIVKELSAADGLITSEGTIYPLLTRLRKDGLVASSWHESPSGPPRRYYRLTDKGATALTEFVAEWRRFRAGVDRLMGGS
jgi:PadR family transcriptional regulator, regulatory protein PadR